MQRLRRWVRSPKRILCGAMLEDSKQLPSKQDGTSRMVKLRSLYNNLTIVIIDNTVVAQGITKVDVQENSAVGNIKF